MAVSSGTRLVGLFVAAMSAALAAQTAQQRPTFRAGVDLIEVDVTIVDGDSYPITDLQASDFSVTVDGEPRRVAQAQYISLGPPEEPELAFPPAVEEIFSSSNTDQTPGRLVVIAVDEASILFGQGRHVMRAAGAFVDSLHPADRVGLVAIPHGVYIDFTSDHDRVRRAVEGLSGLGVRRPPHLLMIGLGEAYRIAEFNDRGTEITVARRFCGDDAEDDINCLTGLRQKSHEIVQWTRYDSGNARRGLESLLGEMRELEGPNTLVWISGGFVIDDQLALLEIRKRAAASRTTLYVMMVPEPLIDMRSRRSFLGTVARDDRRKKEQGLVALAAFTGARLMRAQFNPGPLFERIERELSGYYLLGVQSRPTDRDKERRGIKVSVERDGARVRARQELSFAAADVDQSVDERLARMLRAPMVTQDLPLRVATYAYQATEARADADPGGRRGRRPERCPLAPDHGDCVARFRGDGGVNPAATDNRHAGPHPERTGHRSVVSADYLARHVFPACGSRGCRRSGWQRGASGPRPGDIEWTSRGWRPRGGRSVLVAAR